jgi:heptosyltransferase-2/heptosyltransferase-3
MASSDRDALARRNQARAAQKHARTRKQALRGGLLAIAARLPVRPQSTGNRRVLLIRPDHLGDLLLTVPAVRLLKQTRPDLSLHALVGAWGKPALERLPELDRIETLEFPGFTRQPSAGTLAPYRLLWQAAQPLRQTGYDAAVILRPDHWWGAMLAHLAGIRRVIGFDTPDTRPFLTERVPYVPNRHSVLHSLDLVGALAGRAFDPREAHLHYPLTDDDHQRARALLAQHGHRADQPYVCIHVGSGTRTKQWDATAWRTVAAALAGHWGAFIAFTGSAGERDLCEAAATGVGVPHAVMAGQTDLPTLAALYAGARVVLGPDSGPVHLAAAVHTPTVALFGPAQLGRFATWGKRTKHPTLTSDIGCLGCDILDWPDDPPDLHPCVRDITPARVVAAAIAAVQAR